MSNSHPPEDPGIGPTSPRPTEGAGPSAPARPPRDAEPTPRTRAGRRNAPGASATPRPPSRRAFWLLTLGAVLLCGLFIRLGFWQWDRGATRQAEWNRFQAGTDKIVRADSNNAVARLPRFQRVHLVGTWDPTHQFLLDNRTNNGNAGYEVLTPLERPNEPTVLVDRGWVPFTGHRSTLPNVAFESTGQVAVEGRTDDLPAAGLAAGRAAPPVQGDWPRVTSYPTMTELAAAYGKPLQPRILLLDPKQPNGYVRDWHPPGMQPLRHWSYAIQWWCFAVVVVVFWVVINTRRAQSP